MDRGIAGVCHYLKNNGVITVGSCEGHNASDEAWISIIAGGEERSHKLLRRLFCALHLDEIRCVVCRRWRHLVFLDLVGYSGLGLKNKLRISEYAQRPGRMFMFK
jgi:hypothetical protein